MIAFLKGTVFSLGLDYVLIDVNGVGYKVGFNKPEALQLNSQVFLHTVTIIKEDQHALFGFLTSDEKLMFEQLINVKGIGPKTALAALTVATIEQLTKAIVSEDVSFLKTLPQIGAKSASQIILDLKGKLVNTQSQSKTTPKISDTVEALKQLGYKNNELTGLPAYLATHPDLDEKELIKISLQWLLVRKKGF
jgi:holliday junction DNA helicase RuvA